jgi:hypothetical protein
MRIVHIHGVGDRDHQSLAKQPRRQLENVIDLLVRSDFAGVVTIQVYDEQELTTSLGVMGEVLAKWADD